MRVSLLCTALGTALALCVSFGVHAGELDNEASIMNVEQRLPATVVIRVSAADQSVSVMHSEATLPAQPAQLDASAFTAIANNGSMNGALKNELDQDSSTDSWYFYFSYYNYYSPTYYYGGYNFYYNSYFNYYSAGYTYYYYSFGWWHHC